MCGITGIVNKNKGSILINVLEKMNNLIAHRGPDDEGYFFGKNFAFGHRRLSILDLSQAGHQPMFYDSKDNRYVITYNGEIYNYIEIKEELLKEGYIFKTHTDTEVILASYDKWGEECLKKFNGMWAFAIYDEKKDLIFCSRDRFGIKPFYYYDHKNSFYFFSEIKQILMLDDLKFSVNQEVVYNFLVNAITNYDEKTFVDNVKELRGGHNLVYDLKAHKYKVYKWYFLKEGIYFYNEDEVKSYFFDLITDSVKFRLRSDVEVGSCLSGGLDSSALVSISSDLLECSNILKSVSSCFDEKIFDEREYIDEFSKKIKIINYRVFPDLDDLLDQKVLEKSIYINDTPYSSTSIFAQQNVFKEAQKNRIKVMLDGQGADEILGGYEVFLVAFLAELLNEKKYLKFFKELNNIKKNNIINPVFVLIQSIYFLIPKFVKLLTKREDIDWINGHLFKDIDIKHPYIHFNEREPKFNDVSKAQIFSTNLPKLLHYEDRSSMAYSIESRVPFLDFRIVEFLLSVSSDIKIKNGIRKYILRSSMMSLLPDKIVNRKDKMGFVTPESVWFAKNSYKLYLLLKEAVDTSKFINEDILKEFKFFMDGKKAYDGKFWRVIAYYKWLKVFGVKE